MGLTPGVRALCRKLCKHWNMGWKWKRAERRRCLRFQVQAPCDGPLHTPPLPQVTPRHLHRTSSPCGHKSQEPGAKMNVCSLVCHVFGHRHKSLMNRSHISFLTGSPRWSPVTISTPCTHAPRSFSFHAALTSCLQCCSQSHYLVKHCQEQLSLLFLPGIHSLTLLIPDELQLTSKRANTI